jgi:cytochrome P450
MPFENAPLLSFDSWSGHMRPFIDDRFGLLDRFNRECGDAGRLRFFRTEVLMVNTPALAHELLVEKAKLFEKSPVIRAALYPMVGQGLFTSEHELWRRQRRVMAPLFTSSEVSRYGDAIAACAARGADELPDGGIVDMARAMTRITMAIAGKTLFDIDAFGEADELGAALGVGLQWANDTALSTSLLVQIELRYALEQLSERRPFGPLRSVVRALEAPILWPGERTRGLRQAVAVLDARVARMIAERRLRGAATDDLLGRLLAARDDDGTALDERQLRDEILTLFIAGHETTANGLAWSLYLLARHPEALARAYAEVDQLGAAPSGPTQADLARLPYLSGVFQEALRLYPPVFLFERIALSDTTIGPYAVPRGGIVVVSPYTLHRRADVWPEPLAFDPDRFTRETSARRHRLAWLPFGAGPRVCIGQPFAMLEGPLVLATLLSRLELSRFDPHEVKPDATATMRPQGGIFMRVKRRAPGGAGVASGAVSTGTASAAVPAGDPR